MTSGLGSDKKGQSLVFIVNACNACHGDDGAGATNIVGEGYSSIAKHARDGQDHTGGAAPDLTDQEIADIAAFLAAGES